MKERLTDEEKLAIYKDTFYSKTEKWKNIRLDGYKTYYMISNLGRVCNKVTGNFSYGGNGRYLSITLNWNNKKYQFQMHRLVAQYFCNVPKRYIDKGLTIDDLVVNHKNGLKHCNASFNLEWVTQKENTDHAWKEGLCESIQGENTHLAKITEETAKQIINGIMAKKANDEISKELNVNKKTIQHIRSKECWKYLSNGLTFPKLASAVPYTKSDEMIHEICKLLEEKKYTDPAIAAKFGVNREYVRDIRNHKRRKDISSSYNF